MYVTYISDGLHVNFVKLDAQLRNYPRFNPIGENR